MNSKTVLFDFGGVLATEGFQEGLQSIADKNHLDFDDFFATATEIMYGCGYIVGKNDESGYWRLVRTATKITGIDEELTAAILDRFHLRAAMFRAVDRLQQNGIACAILSDQTDWLDRLEKRFSFFGTFTAVFNSYHTGMTKRDPAAFYTAAQDLDKHPNEILFVDDNMANTTLAKRLGFQVHHFTAETPCLQLLATLGIRSA